MAKKTSKSMSSTDGASISRRGVLAAGALATGIALFPKPRIATASWGSFNSFEPDDPYAKPCDLRIDYVDQVSDCVPPSSWWHNRGAAKRTNVETYYTNGRGSLFDYHGSWFTVIPLDYASDWGTVTWPRVGTYKGRPVGCRLTLSNPTQCDTYNAWGHANGWPGDRIYGYPMNYGSRHFFVACDGFLCSKCHWLMGLSSLKMTYEFFYTGDEGNIIDLEWAYLTENSIQADGGGYEWAGPADNHQGHYFVPSGTNSVLCFTSHQGHGCLESPYDEISDRTTVMFDYKGKSISCWRGDTVGQDGFQFNFEPIRSFARIKLKKTSKYPDVSLSSDRFSLEGAEYNVYCDSACTRLCGKFITDENGDATVQAVNGTDRLITGWTYYIKETKPSPGYLLDETVYKVVLNSDSTVNVIEEPEHADVRYHVDGIDDASIVFIDRVDAGNYSVNPKATEIGTKPDCNLDQGFGSLSGNGFTRWFIDKELTRPFTSQVLSVGDTLDLYARNRASVRFDYTDDSLKPDGRTWRTAADASATVSTSLKLTDWAERVENHKLDGILLPNIGDDGNSHVTVYHGETVQPIKPDDAFVQEPDGTWRRYTCDCWLKAPDGGDGSTVSKVTVKHDTALYIRWRIANAEGVEGHR